MCWGSTTISLNMRISTNSTVKDLINLTYNLDQYDFYPEVEDEEALGRLYLQAFGAIHVPEALVNYIDYEAYGRDARIKENGHFAPSGYVRGSGEGFQVDEPVPLTEEDEDILNYDDVDDPDAF